MTSLTTTALELEEHSRPTVTHREGPNTSSVQEEPIADPLLQASRLADSEVPEGGYGWVVVACCAVLAWWQIGSSYSWGVIQSVLVENGLSTPTKLSFVGSLSPTLMAAVAILSSRVMRSLGVRKTALMAISLIGLAEILSGFTVKSLPGLFITEGVVLGLGYGLCFMVLATTPAQYFSRKRGLANGVVVASGGLGGAVLSIALDPLMRHAGPAWAFRILGLATLATGLPAAWFIKERTALRRGGFVEWGLFKDLKFVLVFIAGALGTFPIFVPPFFIPLYTRALGMTSGTGAGLLAGFNFASAVGRIISGVLCDLIGPLNSLLLSLSTSAISMLVVWPASKSLAPLAIFVVINGMANGGFFATMPTVVGNVFGSARVSVAMGMIVTSWGAGYLMGAPIAGYLLDAYGGSDAGFEAYRPAMIYAGSMALGAAGLVEGVRLQISRNPFAKL